MKRLAWLLLLIPALVLAQNAVLSVSLSSALTGSTPALVSDGASLENASGYTVVLSAPSGQTITGGSLLCWYYGCVTAGGSGTACTRRWMRCPASLDFTPATGVRDAPSGDYITPTGAGRITYVPSSVTVSSGSTVVTTITVRKKL